MIDIHTHILPGIDDGSVNFDMSVLMLEKAKSIGVTHIILTPHAIFGSSYYKSKETLFELFEDFKEKVEYIGIKLYLGSEIYYSEKNYKNLLNGELVTFNNSVYCLVEYPMHEETEIEETLYNIRVKGYKPILAHPERYKFLDSNKVRQIRLNALIQVNTTSILGLHGKKIKKFAFELMKLNLVDFISSDCHDLEDRNVNLDEAYKIVSKKFGDKYANKVFIQNQKKLIEKIENGLV
ncbi:MAG: CpsB/CapC family capsule biosynthesis tyrosine phosphatase [Bacilli bacterium]